MTHAGSSYELDTPEALAALAEQERAGCVSATQLESVTEVRTGV